MATDEPLTQEERHSLKNWANGPRRTVLEPHLEPYAMAKAAGPSRELEYWQQICREYFAVIGWRLGDTEQPPLPLPTYDPLALPIEEKLSEAEAAQKTKRVKELSMVSQRRCSRAFVPITHFASSVFADGISIASPTSTLNSTSFFTP